MTNVYTVNKVRCCDRLKQKSMHTKRMHTKSASRTEDSDARIKHDISEKVVRTHGSLLWLKRQ